MGRDISIDKDMALISAYFLLKPPEKNCQIGTLATKFAVGGPFDPNKPIFRINSHYTYCIVNKNSRLS
jgi:hypothetical protein